MRQLTFVTNSQSLKLILDERKNQLIEVSDKDGFREVAIGPLELLQETLLEKHNETFWIKADSTIQDGKEHFHFKTVVHTKKTIISQFNPLLGQGIITLDHLIKRTPDGKVSEKGHLFKTKLTIYHSCSPKFHI